MGKKIIHQLLPMDYTSGIVDDFLISPATAQKFHEHVKNLLGDEYIVITSPFETKCIVGDEKVFNIDEKEYSLDELLEIIEKANMYDGLCK